MYTIEQYHTLKSAIASGATVVWYGDKKVEYRSLVEMKEILNLMYNELFPTEQLPGRPNSRRVVVFSKGL